MMIFEIVVYSVFNFCRHMAMTKYLCHVSFLILLRNTEFTTDVGTMVIAEIATSRCAFWGG